MIMETMQPTLKSGRNTWDRINMPASEFQARVRKIRRAMKREGMNLLLLYGHGFNEYGNYCYLSNYVIRLPQGAVVAVPSHGDVTLMLEGAARGVSSVKKMTWITDVRAGGDVAKECVNYIQEKKHRFPVIGVAGMDRLMPHHQAQFLVDSLPGCRIISADPLLQEARMVKSGPELLQIRRAARIVRNAFDFIAAASFKEADEKFLEAAVRREARLEGAEDFRMMIARPGEKGWSFRPPATKTILSADRVMISLSVEFERYWAAAIRTYSFQGAAFTEVLSDGMQALSAGIRADLKVGNRTSQFTQAVLARIAASGREFLSDYGLGQGIGLSPEEYPVLARDDRATLREGITLSLRFGVLDPEFGAMMNGDTIYLSRKGIEILTK
jgi:Xaa-Pro aminopeptidase